MVPRRHAGGGGRKASNAASVPSENPHPQRSVAAESRPAMAVHPLAEILPMLPDEELDALAASIAETGLRHAILTAELPDPESGELVDVIVDGRNRLEACRRAGVEPKFERVEDVDVGALILAENVERRNLDAGQRAMARAVLVPVGEKGGRGKTIPNSGEFTKAQSNALGQARFVLENEPTFVAAIMAGTVSLHFAYVTARAAVRPTVSRPRPRSRSRRHLAEMRKQLGKLSQAWTDACPGVREQFLAKIGAAMMAETTDPEDRP